MLESEAVLTQLSTTTKKSREIKQTQGKKNPKENEVLFKTDILI